MSTGRGRDASNLRPQKSRSHVRGAGTGPLIFHTDDTVVDMSREGSSQLRPFTVDSDSWIFAAMPRRDVHPCPSSSFLSAGGILSKCCGTRIDTASIKQPFKPLPEST